MSRVAKKPIDLGKVELNVQSDSVTAKGPKGTLSLAKPAGIAINVDNGVATLSTENADLVALTGTVRAILSNMVKGVSEGFERKLELVGVGYRAAMQGKDLSLSLGFSHPVVFVAPEGITLSTPTQTGSWSRALTSRSSVKLPPRSVRSASRSRTRARA